MGHEIVSKTIPGTVLERSKMNGADGMEFLDKVYFITDGIMLTQIREISGIDGTTLQNWLKRGWVANPYHKLYSKEHLARILLINMMRDTMQLSRIAMVLQFINGDVDTVEDDIIPESRLYDYACRVVAMLADAGSAGLNDLESAVEQVLSDYEEKVRGAHRRLAQGLSIIVTAYYGSLVKRQTDVMIDEYCHVPKTSKRFVR